MQFFYLFSIGLCIATMLLSNATRAEPHLHPKPIQQVVSTATPQVVVNSATTITSRPTSYRRFDADVPLTDWLEANNTVRQIGGWRAYAKEAIRANATSNQPEAASPQLLKRGEKP